MEISKGRSYKSDFGKANGKENLRKELSEIAKEMTLQTEEKGKCSGGKRREKRLEV